MGSSSSAGARRRRVAVVVDAVAETAERLTSDVVSSVDDVRRVLRALGFDPVLVEFAGDPGPWLGALRDGGFDAVFNLCEGLGGQGSEEHLAAAAVELLGLPLTGARALTLGLCCRKDLVNAVLRAAGFSVPDWAVARAGAPLAWRRYPALVKPAAEDASMGIDARSVVRNRQELHAALERGHRRFERLLVQQYVDGREFNLALVGDRVLPHSEIRFSLPAGRPRIVSYAAKWQPGSVDYRGTPPRLLGADEALLGARLTRLAQGVWAAVDGVGYGRVDVRMDGRGRLHVIDVNPNPDLSPDAGLARQAAAADWTYADLIGRIVDLAFATQDPLARARGRRAAARA
jgi:D-alanine-D-alanine ligase